MGQSAGAGSPCYFQCWACRKKKPYHYEDDPRAWRNGAKTRVRLTGRTRAHYTKRGSALGGRNDHVSREYECLDCGHVGWSSHIDLKGREDA